jgi:hypothetical protein
MGRDDAGLQGPDERSRLGDVLHASARGAVGAMAMTGMRVLTTELGLVEQTPPQAVSRQRAPGARAVAAGAAQAAPGAGRRRPLGLRRGRRRGVRRPAPRRAPPPLGRAWCMESSCGWASSWGSRPSWASARPSASARSTVWRWPPTTCCTAWCYRRCAGARKASRVWAARRSLGHDHEQAIPDPPSVSTGWGTIVRSFATRRPEEPDANSARPVLWEPGRATAPAT